MQLKFKNHLGSRESQKLEEASLRRRDYEDKIFIDF